MSGYTASWAVSLPRVDAETGAEQHPPRRFGKLKYLLASDFLHFNYYRRNRYGFDRNHSGFHAAMWKVPHPDGWRAGLEEVCSFPNGPADLLGGPSQTRRDREWGLERLKDSLLEIF